MTASRISFLIFMLACCTGFCALGIWQVKRLHWKEGLITQIDQAYAAKPVLITPDKASSLQKDQFIRGKFFGRFRFDQAFNLMGQIDGGKQTSHLMVPYILDPKVTVLVDMGPGFMPKGNQKPTAHITGLLKNAPQPNKFTPDNNPAQNIWYSVNTAQLKIENLKPLVIMPEETPWKKFTAQKPELRNAHLQYAVFWFTMAGLILALTLYFITRRK